MTRDDGYKPFRGFGCEIRADVIEVYPFARTPDSDTHFLQLLRAREPMARTGHPAIGHCEQDAPALACAPRELREEIDHDVRHPRAPRAPRALGMWAMEQTYPYFIHHINAVVCSPRFAVEVPPDFVPTLNDEHTDARWIARTEIDARFLWPGQRMTARDILREIVDAETESAKRLRIDTTST